MELLGKELVQCAQSFDLKGVSAILITNPSSEVLNFQNNVLLKHIMLLIYINRVATRL